MTDDDGCSVITSKNVEIGEIYSFQDIGICQDQSFENYKNSGIYTDTLTSIFGCDSIRTINLSILPPIVDVVNANICSGESYFGYTESGTYIDSLIASNGCDSLRLLNLSLYLKIEYFEYKTICESNNYLGYTASGKYIDKFQTKYGCDSIRNLELTVYQKYTTEKSMVLCSDSRYIFNGYKIIKSGNYFDTIPSIFGCDCIIKKSPHENTIWFDKSIGKTKTVTSSGTYWAKAIDNYGCHLNDTIQIQFNKSIIWPNIFSSNFDGLNDCFKPELSNSIFEHSTLRIYDRWGNLVFKTNNRLDCWDGFFNNKIAENGVYVFLIELESKLCGNQLFKGDDTLIK